MSNANIKNYVKSLYQAVDNKDVSFLEKYLANNICFCIGNNPVVKDKTQILLANKQFFSSIHSMAHTIEDVTYHTCEVSQQSKIYCYGRVDYVRLNGSEHSAQFSTFLKIEEGLIRDYFVFVDLSGL